MSQKEKISDHGFNTSAMAIHVEVLQLSLSSARTRDVENCVRSFLHQKRAVYNNSVFHRSQFAVKFLKDNVDKITILALGDSADEKIILTEEVLSACQVHVYRLIDDEPFLHNLGPDNGGDREDAGDVPAGRCWSLPSVEFEGLWENLIYDTNIKEEILSYAETMLLFADKKVDQNVISCNRVLLFHGPPGTGKTTLCKALAQKLCIRFNGRYKTGRFLEVNSHSLFSKWFAESGKLVSKLFAKIHEMLEDETALLIVLIDEVESLTVARKKALAGNEPSDAVRVVNALLTQIDYIRRWPNVLVLTTSNVAEAVDPAFLDRADVKQYVGPPSPAAIYRIFCEAITELHRAGIIAASSNDTLPNYRQHDGSFQCGEKLINLARQCAGLSGRTIRKLPMLAHAYKLGARKNVTLDEFVDALAYAIAKQSENDLRCSSADDVTSSQERSPPAPAPLSPCRNATIG